MAASAQTKKRRFSNECSSTSCTIKKLHEEKLLDFDRLDILFKYHIVWYNEQHKNPLDYYKINSKFRRGVVDYLECFINIDECKNYIQSQANNWRYFIIIISVFNSIFTKIDDILNTFECVHSIYIHEEESNDHLSFEKYMNNIKRQVKIKSIFNDLTKLFSEVSKETLIMNRENFVCKSSVNSTSLSNSIERTACVKYCSSNDYFYNFLDLLTETDANKNGKKVFVEECRHHLFMNKQSILRIVDEFDRTYVPERAVYWYTRNGFLYTLLNQAVRQQDIEALLLMHFFIRDLDLQLLSACECVEDFDWKNQMNLYRGQRMSIDEIEDLKLSYQQGFFQSFLSTTININVAQMFSGQRAITKDNPVQPVLFHFDCSTLKLSRDVANIQHLSDNDAEEEVLFSPLYSFSVRHIDYDEDEHVWKVMCTIDGDETNLPLLLHQHLIKLDLVVRILISTISSNDDSNEEICQIFTNGIISLLDELVIPDGNIITLDENAQVQKNIKHAVTSLFLLKGLKSFNKNSLVHQPVISNDAFAALWDCLATMCKEKGEFQQAQTYHIENMPTILARKINMAQIYRMMGQYEQTWSIYQDLLNECFEYPDKDNFDIFNDIATDMPYVESERAMEIWYPNVLGYLEYIYVQCQKTDDNKSLFTNVLMQRYRNLGQAYWYLVHNKEQTLFCYNRWKEFMDENDDLLGEFYMYLAHFYFIDDPIRAKSLYEQAIVELSISEETWSVDLAICYGRLGYLQKRKCFFIRCFYLLTYVADLAIIRRNHLEEVGECYLYLAKNYAEQNSMNEKTIAKQYCEQALNLFLNVKPPTTNFREMKECIALLNTLKENNKTTENLETINENGLLQKTYNETPITEQQLKQMLEQTLRNLSGQTIQSQLIIDEEIDDEDFELIDENVNE